MARSDAKGSASLACAPTSRPRPIRAGPRSLQPLVKDTLLGRLPRLGDVAGAAVFAASEQGGAMTGAVLHRTCGAIID
jgi:3-oxoacyl-[acyl-carrier protein] reductase